MTRIWIQAARLRTLPAAIAPVLIGVALAIREDKFHFLAAASALIGALIIQIGTNLSNDYFDYLKGADNNRSIAPKRYSSSGEISPEKIRNASYLSLFIAFCSGLLILVFSEASNHLIWLGIICVLCAICYTGGPFPLAYNGLGDLFVILFYGFIAVETTHYVLISKDGLTWAPDIFVCMGLGCITNTVLIVNNYRDFSEDKKNQKKTLVVIFGKKFGAFFHLSCIIISCVVCPFLNPKMLLSSFALPLGVFCNFKMRQSTEKNQFDSLLFIAVLNLTIFGIFTLYGLLFL